MRSILSSRYFVAVAFALLVLFSLNGCKEDEDDNAWQVSALWPDGSRPVPARTHDAVLFLQETAPAGLYLLQGGNATHLNPAGPEVRADYAWSPDGSRFTFSSPGPEGGIYVGLHDNPTSLQRILPWGEHPRFANGNESLVFAGGAERGGIWERLEPEGDVVQVAADGSAPEFSPDGIKLAYLLPTGAIGGRLVVLNRETGQRDSLMGNVLNYSWLGDSRAIVFESIAGGTQAVMHLRLELGAAPVEVGPGTRPAGFPGGTEFVYTSLAADRLEGLRIASPGHPSLAIADRGSWALPANASRIVAQDGNTLIQITR